MLSEERRKILQMVAEGKITAEEAARLIAALNEAAAEAEAEKENGGTIWQASKSA